MTDQIAGIGKKPTLWVAMVLLAVGVFMFGQPEQNVAAWVAAVGVDAESSIGYRLRGLFKIVGIVLALVGGRRTYQELKKS